MKPPHLTLLIVEAHRVVRADVPVPGAKIPPRIYTQQRMTGSPLGETLRAGLALAPGCEKNVWVAASEIWSQTLTLPAAALGGLKDAELAAALAFEAEPLSGIPSSNAAMGFIPVQPPRKDGLVDVNAIAMEVYARDDIQSAVKAAGGKLCGVCTLKDLPAESKALNEQDWIERCAAELQAAPAAFPFIAPAPQKISPLRYWLLGLALEAAVLLVCVGHWKWIARAESEARTSLQKLQTPRKQFDELKAKNDLLKGDLKKLEDERARNSNVIKNAENEVAFQRARISAILRSLSKERSGDIAIQSITAKDTQNLFVEGVTLDPAYADKYAAQLEAALAPAGLRVQPMSKTALTASGGPWRFTLQIKPGLDRTPLPVSDASKSRSSTAATKARRPQ